MYVRVCVRGQYVWVTQCALPGKRQWFIVVTKGRSRPDGTFHVQSFIENS